VANARLAAEEGAPVNVQAHLMLDDGTIAAIAERAAEIVLARLDAQPRELGSPYMTIPEAAQLLRGSRQRVDDLLSSRRLTRVKEGRRTLVLRAEIDEHLNRNGRPTGRPHHSTPSRSGGA
jgi:excisionase family DNA binding protein